VRVLVYGAGAVGSLLGGCLARAGAEVTLLARPAHAAAVTRSGLRVTGPHGRTERLRVGAVSTLRQRDGRFDVVVVGVKGYDTPTVAEVLPGLVSAGGRVVCVQNGVGHEEVVASRAGSHVVVAASLTASVSLKEPGWVVQHTRGGIALAGWEGAEVADLVELFAAGGLRTRGHAHGRSLKWSKLLLNLAANATCAVLDLPPARVYGDVQLFRLERRMLQEAVAVGEALGVRWTDLPGFPVRLLVRLLRFPDAVGRALLRTAVARGRGEKMPSLWYDLRTCRERGHAQSRTEAAFLYGAVAQWGAALGVPAPVNEALGQLVEELSSGRLDPQQFRHNPSALLRAVGTSGEARRYAVSD